MEFLAGSTEYSYEIDLTTGAILQSEQEDHGAPAAPAGGNSGSLIGDAAAKSAALAHAGVSESEISRFEIELDRDDGRTLYEIEFHVGWTEYSYEIDAFSAPSSRRSGRSTTDSAKKAAGRTASRFLRLAVF